MRHAVAVALIMSLAVVAARADVYRSVDAQGHVQYSDTPTPGAELIHVQRLSSASSAPSSPPSASTATSPPQAIAKGSNEKVQDTLTRQAAQQAVQQDLQQTRADQCKTATDNYNQAVQARRLYKPGADGEREYLTDADADAMRVNLKLAMQTACGSQ